MQLRVDFDDDSSYSTGSDQFICCLNVIDGRGCSFRGGFSLPASAKAASTSQYFAMVRTAFSRDLTAAQRALNLDLYL